jgi:hypothetical protein
MGFPMRRISVIDGNRSETELKSPMNSRNPLPSLIRVPGQILLGMGICMILGGCVRFRVNRSETLRPEAPIEIERINPVAFLSSVGDSEPLSVDPKEPLPAGVDIREIRGGLDVRATNTRKRTNRINFSRDFLSTSRAFESPPIDPLGQTSVMDRPLFQR